MDSRLLSAYLSGDYQASCKNYAPLVITRTWAPVMMRAGQYTHTGAESRLALLRLARYDARDSANDRNLDGSLEVRAGP